MSQIRALHGMPIVSAPACLVVTYPGAPGGVEVGLRFELSRGETILGRGTDADIQIERDAVSRRHARIARKDGTFRVCDLQSTNGVYVNDALTQEQELKDGDLVQFGDVIFRFLCGPHVVPD